MDVEVVYSYFQPHSRIPELEHLSINELGGQFVPGDFASCAGLSHVWQRKIEERQNLFSKETSAAAFNSLHSFPTSL